MVFAIFEMRFLLSVWRARRTGVDAWTAQREVSVLYARFYATLLGGILLTYQLQRCARRLAACLAHPPSTRLSVLSALSRERARARGQPSPTAPTSAPTAGTCPS